MALQTSSPSRPALESLTWSTKLSTNGTETADRPHGFDAHPALPVQRGHPLSICGRSLQTWRDEPDGPARLLHTGFSVPIDMGPARSSHAIKASVLSRLNNPQKTDVLHIIFAKLSTPQDAGYLSRSRNHYNPAAENIHKP
jgi:hypothetical protein